MRARRSFSITPTVPEPGTWTMRDWLSKRVATSGRQRNRFPPKGWAGPGRAGPDFPRPNINCTDRYR